MGELHLQIVVDRLKREYGVEASVGKPQVVYRETIGASAEGAAVFERELKEANLYGEVRCRIAPRDRGTGIRIESEIPEGTLRSAIADAALAGLREATETGPNGFPMDDLEATLLDVSFRDDEQPEVGVNVAAGEAFSC